MCRAVCVRACGRGPGQIDLSAWLDLSWSIEPPGGRGKSGVTREGVGEETTNLLSALLINAGEGQVGVWLKEGRSEWGGREKGRLFVGIDLCWGGAGDPRRAPVPGGGGGEEGGGGAWGDPRPEQPSRGAHAAVPFR